MKKLRVRIIFTEELLGTASNDPEIQTDFIISRGPNARTVEEEIAAIDVQDQLEKTKTVFSRDDQGRPIMWDYQIKGFFKDTCSALKKIPGSESSKIKAFKKEIDGLVFVFPRKIPLIFTGEVGSCQRPLRASTAQGERVALAHSETVPAGTFAEMEIHCLLDSHEDAVKEWLDHGALRGLGQWRNSGKGRFTWEIL